MCYYPDINNILSDTLNIRKHIKQQAPNNLAPRLRIFPTQRHIREFYGADLPITILSLHRHRRKNYNSPVYLLDDSPTHNFMHFLTNQMLATENKKDFAVDCA